MANHLLHLAVELDGDGAHPAAWRRSRHAENAGFTIATFDDGVLPPAGGFEPTGTMGSRRWRDPRARRLHRPDAARAPRAAPAADPARLTPLLTPLLTLRPPVCWTAGVKYADGPTVEVDVLVEAPVERVWALVTDIELPARFSPEFCGATWLDDGAPRLDARFVGRNHHDALGDWETTSFVTRFEPNRAFAWDVSDPANPSSSWWFLLDEVAGGVRLRQGTRMGPARSGLSYAIDRMPDKEERIVARRLREFEESMRATVEGIKRLAEDGA